MDLTCQIVRHNPSFVSPCMSDQLVVSRYINVERGTLYSSLEKYCRPR
jgi:hypothetical protein